MLRILIILIITGFSLTAGFAQIKRSPEAKYTAAKGRCGTIYFLENTPRFFGNPRTKSELEYVVRVLKSAPPQADIKCRDFTDAWSAYLYADRKVLIARLLIRLKKNDEAREELWSVFSNRPVLYRNSELFYSFGTDEAAGLLVGKDLWDANDFSRRLKSGKYFTEELEEAYEERLQRKMICKKPCG